MHMTRISFFMEEYNEKQNIPHCQNNSKHTTLSEQFKTYHTVGTIQNIPHCRNNSKHTTLSEQFKTYHTVGTIPKSNIKIIERGKIDNP